MHSPEVTPLHRSYPRLGPIIAWKVMSTCLSHFSARHGLLSHSELLIDSWRMQSRCSIVSSCTSMSNGGRARFNARMYLLLQESGPVRLFDRLLCLFSCAKLDQCVALLWSAMFRQEEAQERADADYMG